MKAKIHSEIWAFCWVSLTALRKMRIHFSEKEIKIKYYIYYRLFLLCLLWHSYTWKELHTGQWHVQEGKTRHKHRGHSLLLDKSGMLSSCEVFSALLSIQWSSSLHGDAVGYSIFPVHIPVEALLPAEITLWESLLWIAFQTEPFFGFICQAIVFTQHCSSEEVKSQSTRDIQIGSWAPSTSKREGKPQTRKRKSSRNAWKKTMFLFWWCIRCTKVLWSQTEDQCAIPAPADPYRLVCTTAHRCSHSSILVNKRLLMLQYW